MFAIGDVRHGSIQRVAASVGDGSVVVAQIHRLFDSAASDRPRAEAEMAAS